MKQMNTYMKSIKAIATCITFVMAASCNVLDDLETRLDSLEARVKAIETVIPSLNSNIEALKVLSGGGTINSVENNNGVYKITLSNGEVITLTQGSIGVANAPLFSIDKEGYWLVDYQDGNGASYILQDGKKVKALGTDGLTPELGVNEEGFWTVSYDNGATWTEVLDEDGNPVSAIPSEGADEYFDDVTCENGVFTITLKDGKEISLQIVPNFLFKIIAPETLIEIEEGKAKAYQVISEGVVSATVLSTPAGFNAVLTEEQLLITAPVLTKVSADSDTDIAILAVSKEGFTALSKLKVSVSPRIAEDFNEVIKQDINIENTYYEHWNAGKSIIAGGVTLNKSMFEDLSPILITAESNTPISADGVYFIEPGIEAIYDLTDKKSSRVLIFGNSTERRSDLKINSQLRIEFTNQDDFCVMMNLNASFTTASDYHINILNNAAGEFEYIVFDNCTVTPHEDNLTLHYNGVEGKNVKRFAFEDSEFLVPVKEPVTICGDCGTKQEKVYKMISAAKGQNYQSISIENSVIYSNAPTAVKFNLWDGYASGKKSVTDTLTLKQSSFINLQINNGFVRSSNISHINIQNNIFYTPDATVTSWQYILRPEAEGPESGIGKNNLAYIKDNGTQNYKMFYSDSHMNFIRAEQFRKVTDLFDTTNGAVYDAENVQFIPATPYIEYGAQR